MFWLKSAATATVLATMATSSVARDINPALWQETDLTGAPEVVQQMDACLQEFAAWAPTDAGFHCAVTAFDPSPETSAAIESWMAAQFTGTDNWTVEEGDQVTLFQTAVGDRLTGTGYAFHPAVVTEAPMISIGLVSGTVAGCETGTAFSILATSPELGVPSMVCYDLSSF